MTTRIYLQRGLSFAAKLQVTGENHARLSRVLRLKAGDPLVLFDGSGSEWNAVVESVSKASTTVALGDERRPAREPAMRLHLYQAVIRPALFELVLEKGTELGVASFTPLLSEFSARARDLSPSRMERWRRIIVEAAEQSGRLRLPDLRDAQTLMEALAGASGRVLLAHAGAARGSPPLAPATTTGEISLFIGPEGGFSDEEARAAEASGALVVRMGATTLRSETAGIAGAALLLLGCAEEDPTA